MPVDATTQSTFYLVLTICIAVLTIVISVAIVYLILILRDTSKVLERVRYTVDRINDFILKPVSLVGSIVDHMRPLIEGAISRMGSHHEQRKAGKKKHDKDED